ncbi:MAG: DUF1521 domain-containing protein [Myxococcota bacterium]
MVSIGGGHSALAMLGYTPDALLACLKTGIRGAVEESYQQGFQAGLQTALAGGGLEALAQMTGILPAAGDLSAMQSILGQHSPAELGACTCGSIPQPNVELSGAPAGKGLSKDPPGFPAGSVRTAGGYTVVPEGGTSWKIFGPDQKPGDKPITHVHGDPHVDEKDGTRWDFTKNSDFVLPDGTRINCKTSSEKGYSVSTGLEITNGADRVSVSGVDGRPSTSEVRHDGYEWRAQHLASNPNRDTFRLGGDGDDWFLEKGGKNLGEIKGAHMDHATGAYVQHTDGKGYNIDPNLKPPFGSEAWGNMLRNESIDFIAGRLGLDPQSARDIGSLFHAEHSTSQYMQSLETLAAYAGPFGGLKMLFDGPGEAFNAVSNMGDALNSLMSLNRDLHLRRAMHFLA